MPLLPRQSALGCQYPGFVLSPPMKPPFLSKGTQYLPVHPFAGSVITVDCCLDRDTVSVRFIHAAFAVVLNGSPAQQSGCPQHLFCFQTACRSPVLLVTNASDTFQCRKTDNHNDSREIKIHQRSPIFLFFSAFLSCNDR